MRGIRAMKEFWPSRPSLLVKKKLLRSKTRGCEHLTKSCVMCCLHFRINKTIGVQIRIKQHQALPGMPNLKQEVLLVFYHPILTFISQDFSIPSAIFTPDSFALIFHF